MKVFENVILIGSTKFQDRKQNGESNHLESHFAVITQDSESLLSLVRVTGVPIRKYGIANWDLYNNIII